MCQFYFSTYYDIEKQVCTHSLHLSILGLLSLLGGFAGKDSLSVLVELEADNLALGSIDTDGNGSTGGLVTVDTLDLHHRRMSFCQISSVLDRRGGKGKMEIIKFGNWENLR